MKSMMKDILHDAGLKFQEEYSFKDLYTQTGHPLR